MSQGIRQPRSFPGHSGHSSGYGPGGAFGGSGGSDPKADTDCLVAVLDSCGSVKFSVFSFFLAPSDEDATSSSSSGCGGALTEEEAAAVSAGDQLVRCATPRARSVTTKIPAANASGVSVPFTHTR
jgi:hypothetical protein